MATVVFALLLFDRSRMTRICGGFFTDISRRTKDEQRHKSHAIFAVGATLLAISAAAFVTERLIAVNDVPRSIAYMFLVSVLIVPFVEEFFFRGVILGYLRDIAENSLIKKGYVRILINAAVSAAIFALFHSSEAMLYSFIGGFLISVFVQTSNSLKLGLTIHYANNLRAFAQITLPASFTTYINIAIAVATVMAAVILANEKHKQI